MSETLACFKDDCHKEPFYHCSSCDINFCFPHAIKDDSVGAENEARIICPGCNSYMSVKHRPSETADQ